MLLQLKEKLWHGMLPLHPYLWETLHHWHGLLLQFQLYRLIQGVNAGDLLSVRLVTAGCSHALTQPGMEYFFSPPINQQKSTTGSHQWCPDRNNGGGRTGNQGTSRTVKMTSLLSVHPQKGVTGATAWAQRHPAGNFSWGQNKARFKLLQGILLDLGIQSQPVFVSGYSHQIFDCKHQGISIAGKPFPSAL